ncbi:MAG TPA: hypothetical protein VG389_14165 [Myxococcota bacterium]|nr:hypothetical protein [Myxococcota bacterium]
MPRRNGRTGAARATPPPATLDARLGWTPARLAEEIRRRHAEGRSMKARTNSGLLPVAVALYGGWREALAAANVPALRRGRPPGTRESARARAEREALPPFRCGECGEDVGDLTTHAILAHVLTPRLYEARHGPLPDRRALFMKVTAALRAYVLQGGRPTEAALARRQPVLHRALVMLRFFPDVAAAFHYLGAGGGVS